MNRRIHAEPVHTKKIIKISHSPTQADTDWLSHFYPPVLKIVCVGLACRGVAKRSRVANNMISG